MHILFILVCSSASSGDWQLAMNICPSDGNIMNYCNPLWHQDIQHGDESTALTKDFVSKSVRQQPANYIAIVRHKNSIPDAVKVWKFKETSSLLSWFNGDIRNTVTENGHLHEEILPNAENVSDDPIFSVDGDLIFNYEFADNGVRIVMSGAYRSGPDTNDDNTYGFGMDLAKSYYGESSCTVTNSDCSYEAAPYQHCPFDYNADKVVCGARKVLGTDATGDDNHCKVSKGSDYGSYAIYVGNNSERFPPLKNIINLELSVSFFTSK